jgi:hypothetical protein
MKTICDLIDTLLLHLKRLPKLPIFPFLPLFFHPLFFISLPRYRGSVFFGDAGADLLLIP